MREYNESSKVENLAVGAALVASGATVATLVCFLLQINVWVYAFLGSVLWTIFYAIPLYWFLLYPRNWLGWWTGPVFGFVGIVIPAFFVFLPGDISQPDDGEWYISFKHVGITGLVGLCGGTAAWCAWKLVHKYYPET